MARSHLDAEPLRGPVPSLPLQLDSMPPNTAADEPPAKWPADYLKRRNAAAERAMRCRAAGNTDGYDECLAFLQAGDPKMIAPGSTHPNVRALLVGE